MALPDFLVIGAAKGGTTSIHRYLRRHPEVFVPGVKETNYFWVEAASEGRRTPPDLAGYERCFTGAGGRVVGEVSPRYLISAGAAERIRQELPDVKLVVSLRDPAARAWSDYLGRVRILRETRPFEEAVAPGEPCFEGGMYHDRLAAFYARFDAERIHVMLHDELAADTACAIRSVFAFIGVDPDAGVHVTTRHNVAAAPRSARLNRVLWPAVDLARRALPPRLRGTGLAARAMALTYGAPPEPPSEALEALRRRYADDVRATARLIGRDLSHWPSWRAEAPSAA